MRIMEIANAEEQVALLKLIMDKTWEAVAQQAAQQKQADAQRKAQVKNKPRSRKSLKLPHVPVPPPLNKPKPNLSKQPTPAPKTPNPHALAPIKPLPYSQTQPNPKLNPTTLANPNTAQAPAQNASIASKSGYLGKNIGAKEKDVYGDDRHSKNGIVSPKKLPRNFQ